jgi:hypothetical protein
MPGSGYFFGARATAKKLKPKKEVENFPKKEKRKKSRN